MIEKVYRTRCGSIHYWISEEIKKNSVTLVFLPGLSADHRLFDKQIEYFQDKLNCFVWDAPGHASSYPFEFDFDLFDKARWLDEILTNESITIPVIVGQSMGGYVGQAYSELFKDKLKGFVSIDSAPLQREYTTGIEIYMLKRVEPIYKMLSWNMLFKSGTETVAESEYGKNLMKQMMMVYASDKDRYVKLASHGSALLGKAMEANLEYKLYCPAVLICGAKDKAGSAKYYNKKWSKKTDLPLHMIENAGHNSNTDKPDEVNRIIEDLANIAQTK